jgi:hypothetical protein
MVHGRLVGGRVGKHKAVNRSALTLDQRCLALFPLSAFNGATAFWGCPDGWRRQCTLLVSPIEWHAWCLIVYGLQPCPSDS